MEMASRVGAVMRPISNRSRMSNGPVCDGHRWLYGLKSSQGPITDTPLDKDVFGIEAQSVVRDRLGTDVAEDLGEGGGPAVGDGK